MISAHQRALRADKFSVVVGVERVGLGYVDMGRVRNRASGCSAILKGVGRGYGDWPYWAPIALQPQRGGGNCREGSLAAQKTGYINQVTLAERGGIGGLDTKPGGVIHDTHGLSGP